jgi:hypothetical protein
MAQTEPGTTKNSIHVIIEIGSKCSLMIEIEKVHRVSRNWSVFDAYNTRL